MLVIWAGTGSAVHSVFRSGQNGRTWIEELQGLAHAIARGLVSLKHQRVHDAAVSEGMLRMRVVAGSGRESVKAAGCSLRTEILGPKVGRGGKRDYNAPDASLARCPWPMFN